MAMTEKGIEAALEAIYREMKSWRNINRRLGYRIPADEVSRRELFFIAREELCRLEDAEKSGDRLAEGLHEETYELIKSTLAIH